MPLRSPRTILALSATLALTASALAPTAMLAKGPNGNADCDGDCTAEQPQAQQQIQARDGSGANQKTETRANAGGGGQVQARAGNGNATKATNTSGGQGKNARANSNSNGQGRNARTNSNSNGQGQNAKEGAGQGPNDDGQRGPGSCDDCDAEMGVLTEEQKAGLVFMANEEKMAQDVYAAFAELYDMPIFSNIAESEAMHQQAVGVVLERYGVEDTAIGLPAGEFSNEAIATLHNSLVEQGSASLEEALAAGVLIEKADIADLEVRMEGLEETAPDVYEMYSHLLAASQNHLAAFEGRL